MIATRNQYSIKQTGKSCTIPDNCVAKLMYYLDCFESVSKYGLPEYLRDYKNWDDLDDDDIRVLFNLCQTLDIATLTKIGIFIPVDDDDMNDSNEFLEIKNKREALGLGNGIIIAGKKVNVVKVMVYKMRWAKRNYLEPLQELHKILTRPRIVVVERGNSSSACNVM